MRNNQIDELDLRIIAHLQKDGRQTNREIARKLGVNEATVRKRVNLLREQGIIQIVAVADPRRVGFAIPVTIKVRADIKKLQSVADELCKIEEAWYIAETTGTGEFDVDAIVTDPNQLHSLLHEKIFKIPGVIATETSIILNFLKRDHFWLKAYLESDDSENA